VTGQAQRSTVLEGSTGYPAVDDVIAEAVGRGRRHDPVVSPSGGPAGNARLTAWAGLLAGGRAHRGDPRSVVPGGPGRISAVTASVLAGVITVLLVVPSVTGWHHDHRDGHGPDHGVGPRG
jgi:hypothetical protein